MQRSLFATLPLFLIGGSACRGEPLEPEHPEHPEHDPIEEAGPEVGKTADEVEDAVDDATDDTGNPVDDGDE